MLISLREQWGVFVPVLGRLGCIEWPTDYEIYETAGVFNITISLLSLLPPVQISSRLMKSSFVSRAGLHEPVQLPPEFV